MVRELKGNTELSLLNEDRAIFQGDDETLRVTVENENRETVDISGASSIEYGIFDDSGSQLSKSLNSGISITDGANGVFEVLISSGDTSSLSGDFRHEAEIVDGDTSTLFQGKIKIRETDI